LAEAATPASPRTAIDDAYDNAMHFADVPQWRERWLSRSAAWPRSAGDAYDLHYGPDPMQRIDVLPCARASASPTALFFHGGFWSRNSKTTFRFLARGFHAAGLNVAFAGYTLAPEARMARIVEDARGAVRWLRQALGGLGLPGGALIVVGWSAGAHLAAMVMDEPAVAAGMGISGVYDLSDFRRSAMNDMLRLDAADVERYSPTLQTASTAKPFLIAYGARELPAYREQSQRFHAALQGSGVPSDLLELEGHHHHSVLEELSEPDGALVQRLAALARLRGSA